MLPCLAVCEIHCVGSNGLRQAGSLIGVAKHESLLNDIIGVLRVSPAPERRTGSRSIDRRSAAFTISLIIASRVASSPRFRLLSTTLLLHFSLESSSTCDRTQRQNRSDSLGLAFSMRYYTAQRPSALLG